MITGLSFSPHFSLSDHKDIIRDLGNCMFVSLSCFLAGSASGAQLTSGTLASLPWIHPLLHQSLWCRMKAKILLVAYKVLPNLAPAYLSSLALPSLTRLLFLFFCSSSHCPLFVTCQVSAQTPPLYKPRVIPSAPFLWHSLDIQQWQVLIGEVEKLGPLSAVACQMSIYLAHLGGPLLDISPIFIR